MADPYGLTDAETILWEGRPDTKLRFGMETMATGIFALALVLGCLGIATVVERTMPGVYWQVLLPGLILGLGIVMTFPLLDTLKRGRTTYAISNKRIIIKNGRAQKNYAIPPADQLILRGDAPPTLTFGRARNNRPLSLERIGDGPKALEILQDLAQKRAASS